MSLSRWLLGSPVKELDAYLDSAVNNFRDAAYLHGASDAFALMLGIEREGVRPFSGPLTPEAEAWARAMLHAIANRFDEENHE